MSIDTLPADAWPSAGFAPRDGMQGMIGMQLRDARERFDRAIEVIGSKRRISRCLPTLKIHAESLAEKGRPIPEPTDDATFARRAHLDLNGLLPEPAALDTFLADQSPGRRERLVDLDLGIGRVGGGHASGSTACRPAPAGSVPRRESHRVLSRDRTGGK